MSEERWREKYYDKVEELNASEAARGKLVAAVEMAKAGLMFYSDPDNWESATGEYCAVRVDGGDKARAISRRIIEVLRE